VYSRGTHIFEQISVQAGANFFEAMYVVYIFPPKFTRAVYICNVMLYTNRLAVSANYFRVYRIYLGLRAVGPGKGGGGEGEGGCLHCTLYTDRRSCNDIDCGQSVVWASKQM
jgi:hypothetical protein